MPEIWMQMKEYFWMKYFVLVLSSHLTHVVSPEVTRRNRIDQHPHRLYLLFALGLKIIILAEKDDFRTSVTRAQLVIVLGEKARSRAHLISCSGSKCCVWLWRLVNSSVLMQQFDRGRRDFAGIPLML